jgi:CDP-diacylglycerol--serine O-phosphatidyltransferase
MKLHLPNALTSCNLFSGCIAAVMIFRNHLEYAAYFIFLSAFFDLLDGMVARRVSSNSAFGKELDSLADAVSFGFIPGAMMFKLLQLSNISTVFHSELLIRGLQFFPFIITVFSALRLAKFNLDTRQSNSFIGLPTPACTLFIVSFPLILNQLPGRFEHIILNPYFIIVTSVILSFLLVSEIPLFSMKFKTFMFRENIFQYLLLILSVIIFPVFLFASIPIVIILYILLSIIQNSLKSKI